MTDERPADESSEPQASSDIDSPMPFLELPSEEMPPLGHEPLLPTSLEPPVPADLLALPGLAQQILARLDQLEDKFDATIRNDAKREAIVDRLHAEVQEYRTDLLLKVLRPVLLDLITLHDEMGKALTASQQSESDRRGVSQLLVDFQQDVADILSRQGVEPFTVEGEEFDPRQQRASRTLPAPEPGLEGRIAARLRPGFRTTERVLRPELVTVYTKASTAPAQPTSQPEETRP